MTCEHNEIDSRNSQSGRVTYPIKPAWRLFCSHGTVLFYIAQHPRCTISDIADALALTPRTVWGLMGDLKRAGLVDFKRVGKRHHYTVNGGGHFPDPLIAHLTLDDALKAIARDIDQAPSQAGPMELVGSASS